MKVFLVSVSSLAPVNSSQTRPNNNTEFIVRAVDEADALLKSEAMHCVPQPFEVRCRELHDTEHPGKMSQSPDPILDAFARLLAGGG